jgi:hypothetical protein
VGVGGGAQIRTFDIRAGRLTTDDLHHPITSLRLSNDKNCALAGALPYSDAKVES